MTPQRAASSGAPPSEAPAPQAALGAGSAFPAHRLLIIAFIGGLVSLALELAAARLLAPAFGTTEIVWTTVIGLILLYLSAGYALGGRWADRDPNPATLFTILVAAGLAISVIPIASRPLLLIAARGMQQWNLGLLAGPFFVILILFVVPVTLLACVSPFAVRLNVSDVASSGGAIGRFTAVSTLGSFIGTFLPNMVLIPTMGTRRTFLLLALVTLATGLWGLWSVRRRRFWALAWTTLIIVILFAWEPGFVKPQTAPVGTSLIYEEESSYNLIQVLEDGAGHRYLLLNEGQGIHSIYTPPELYSREDQALALLTGGPWDIYLVAPYFNAPPHPPDRVQDLLVIGLAAGTTPAQFTEVYGPLPIDGVEIDAAIISVGRTFFGMTMPNLNAVAADGRTYLLGIDHRYSVIAVDAYRLPYIPWHLTTVEFFRTVKDHLREDGVVAINVGYAPSEAPTPSEARRPRRSLPSPPGRGAGGEGAPPSEAPTPSEAHGTTGGGDWRLVAAMVNTMRQVYPSVHVISIPGSFNAIVIATVQETTPENLTANLPLLGDPRLELLARQSRDNLRTPAPSTLVFTDDHAPVERLTHAVALRYVLGLP